MILLRAACVNIVACVHARFMKYRRFFLGFFALFTIFFVDIDNHTLFCIIKSIYAHTILRVRKLTWERWDYLVSVTIRDIAEAAGVSVGTVDRALHGRGRISPEVEQRILLLAAQLNYHSNTAAQSLAASRRKYRIAVVLHIYQNCFYTDIQAGIARAQTELSPNGMEIQIYHCHDFDAADQLHQIETALADGADALIIVPIDDPLIRKRLQELAEREFPIVFLSSVLSDVPCLSSVHPDYRKSGQLAAGLIRLLSRGEGGLLIFSPSLRMAGHRLRVESIQNSLHESCPQLYIFPVVELANDSFECYMQTVQALKTFSDADSLIYCGNTRAGLKALSECGRKLSAVFYDMTFPTEKALDTGIVNGVIYQNPNMQGYRAITLLYEYLVFKKKPPAAVEVENQILIAESLPYGTTLR